jgi:glycosyltransferase involved in cell wall biosynthesis
MRVALLSASAPSGDAIGNQVAEKLAFFLERGADVAVFLESDQRLHPAVKPFSHVLSDAEPHGAAWVFLSSADLVIAEFGHSYRLLGLLPLLARGKPRLVIDYHGITPTELWSAHNREGLETGLHQRGVVWCADAAIVHSRFTARELTEPTGFPEARVFRLGHPLDTDRLGPGPSSLREQLGLRGATLLLFVGRLAPNKRLPILIQALTRLHDRMPPVHALILGDDSDLYQTEAQQVLQQAGDLGVGDRVHILGAVSDERLLDAYRCADAFLMPSRHEGFCIPVIEAMACGLPVIAARAGALPETVGDAGLTFTPDDANDLARQIRRVLDDDRPTGGQPKPSPTDCVAIVACRYGTDFVGGAEASLRTIAQALSDAGHSVEVFTTCTRAEDDWTDQSAEGTVTLDGIPVHRYPVDPHDHERHLASLEGIVHANGPLPIEAEQEYLAHSIHSSRLLADLRRQDDRFDAIVVGPYLFGLTHDVAREVPEHTLLLPCFHDEPFARLRTLRETYEPVGGILYHSPEEQQLAEIDLGLNHPGATCIGTHTDTNGAGDPARGQDCVGAGRRYLVYCGRYSEQKNVPLLLDYARRYHERHPGRFTFAFMGQGDVSIPRESWARDLGFVDPATQRDVLAGAAALVQLSHYESLSLVALEAWAQRVPVIAATNCRVLAGHLERCGGGQAVDGYDAFAVALDDLWDRPARWQEMGERGQEYVADRYGSRAVFTNRLLEAIGRLREPLAEQMRRKGRQRAATFARSIWRERFGQLIEDLLHAPARPYRERVEVRPRSDRRTVSSRLGETLVPVQVVNHGTHAVVHEGPARMVLRSELLDHAGTPINACGTETPLPSLVLPGQAVSAAVAVPIPAVPGTYSIGFRAERVLSSGHPNDCPPSSMRLIVEDRQRAKAAGCCTPLLETVQAALVRADRLQRLPTTYTDITEGWFASCKRWIKRKLLGNFKRAYVDVLSRQQSAFNQEVVRALHELAECCATLDHARTLARGAGNANGETSDSVQSSLVALRTRLAELETRLLQGSSIRPSRTTTSARTTYTTEPSEERAS